VRVHKLHFVQLFEVPYSHSSNNQYSELG